MNQDNPPQDTSPSVKRLSGNNVLNVAFLMCLFLPLITLLVTPIEPISEVEKRRLAEFPEFDPDLPLRETVSAFETAFNDHFGFREQLIATQRYLTLKSGESPNPEVTLGKEDWWYLTATVTNYESAVPLTAQELETLDVVFRTRQAWLRSQGIEYLVMLAPDKPGIYPEYLPDDVIAHEGTPPYDQVAALLRESSVPYVDPKPILLTTKESGTVLYFKQDTHWNALGGHLAASELQKAIYKLFPDQTLPDVEAPAVLIQRHSMDLAQLMGVDGLVFEDAVFGDYAHTCGTLADYDGQLVGMVDFQPPRVTRCADQSLNVFTAGDSFFESVFPNLLDSFGEHMYVYGSYQQHVVEARIAEQPPDLVIDEMVERQIIALARYGYGGYGDPAWIISQMPRLYLMNDTAAELRMFAAFNADLTTDGNALRISPTAEALQLAFTLPTPVPAQQLVAVRIRMTSPEAGSFGFYHAADIQSVDGTVGIQQPLHAGENEFILVFYSTGGFGAFKINLTGLAGDYTINLIEVRAASPDVISGR